MEERKHETASEEGTDEHSDESGLSKMFLHKMTRHVEEKQDSIKLPIPLPNIDSFPQEPSSSDPQTPKSTTMQDSQPMLEVYVRGISFRARDDQIEAYFRECGEIERITIPRGQDKKPKGYCFVQFKSETGVQNALARNKEPCLGRQLDIRRNTRDRAPAVVQPSQEERRHHKSPQEKPDECKTIFVGNLPFTITADEIKQEFVSCGPVKDVRIVRQSDGKSRGFVFISEDSKLCGREERKMCSRYYNTANFFEMSLGEDLFCYIEFLDERSVTTAMGLRDKEIGGRSVRVDFAVAFDPEKYYHSRHYDTTKPQAQNLFRQPLSPNGRSPLGHQTLPYGVVPKYRAQFCDASSPQQLNPEMRRQVESVAQRALDTGLNPPMYGETSRRHQQTPQQQSNAQQRMQGMQQQQVQQHQQAMRRAQQGIQGQGIATGITFTPQEFQRQFAAVQQMLGPIPKITVPTIQRSTNLATTPTPSMLPTPTTPIFNTMQAWPNINTAAPQIANAQMLYNTAQQSVQQSQQAMQALQNQINGLITPSPVSPVAPGPYTPEPDFQTMAAYAVDTGGMPSITTPLSKQVYTEARSGGGYYVPPYLPTTPIMPTLSMTNSLQGTPSVPQTPNGVFRIPPITGLASTPSLPMTPVYATPIGSPIPTPTSAAGYSFTFPAAGPNAPPEIMMGSVQYSMAAPGAMQQQYYQAKMSMEQAVQQQQQQQQQQKQQKPTDVFVKPKVTAQTPNLKSFTPSSLMWQQAEDNKDPTEGR